jgi:hypothetical protein
MHDKKFVVRLSDLCRVPPLHNKHGSSGSGTRAYIGLSMHAWWRMHSGSVVRKDYVRLVGVAEAQTRQRPAGRSGRGAGAQAGRPTEAEARPGGGAKGGAWEMGGRRHIMIMTCGAHSVWSLDLASMLVLITI